MKSSSGASQPVPVSGAKFGMAAESAAMAGHKAALHKNPAKMARGASPLHVCHSNTDSFIVSPNIPNATP
jgi:hypothetical protein